MRQIIEVIREYMAFRKQTWPTGQEALLFTVTEIGEAVDAMLRQDSKWVRNNQKESNIGDEIGDVAQMLEIASYELTGKSATENMLEKMKKKGYTP